MRRSNFLLIALASTFVLRGSASAVTVATDPVGFTNLSLPAESDSYISVPFTRPPEFVGAIQSINANTITVAGTPGWGANKFVYAPGSQPNNYYALIGGGGSSNPKEGHTYLINGSGANTITVDISADDLADITQNTQVTIIPYWTPATVFPATDANISFTPTSSTAAYKTQIIVPDDSAPGINLPALATYYFKENAGWRVVGDDTTDRGDDTLLPDSYFIVRNQNGAPGLPLTTLGAVLTKKLAVLLRTRTDMQQDNPVSILRPLDVSLSMTGLNPTDGSFGANDQLLLFSNSQIGFNKTPVTYYRDPANFNWRRVGDNNLLDHGNDVIPVGTGFIVRKAATGSGAPVFWTNSFPVQALSAVSRKQHGGAGTFDLNLPLTGAPAIEPRDLGSGYQIVITFPVPVTFNNAAVSSGSGSASVSGSGTTQATITLTGAVTKQFVTVTLAGVNDGVNTNDVAVTMGILVGDASRDGTVNSGDSFLVRSRSGSVAGATSFMFDINADGNVNSGDATIVRARSGQSLSGN